MLEENILEVEGLSKKYDTFSLRDVSFSLPKGSIMGLVGENGAGKSTTMKGILGILHPDSGKIRFWGREAADASVMEDIGVVFDENHFSDILTPLEISKFLRKIYRQWDEPYFLKLLGKFNLPVKKAIKDFSRGMKMKLGLAAALGHRPKLLMLDEPTSGLDPVVRNEILDLFLDFIADGECSILLSSHITTDLEKVADYIVFLHQGKVKLSGVKDDLLENYGVMKGPKDSFSQVNSKDIAGYKQRPYGFECLVKSRSQARRSYPDFMIDPASLEDIMLYLVQDE